MPERQKCATQSHRVTFSTKKAWVNEISLVQNHILFKIIQMTQSQLFSTQKACGIVIQNKPLNRITFWRNNPTVLNLSPEKVPYKHFHSRNSVQRYTADTRASAAARMTASRPISRSRTGEALGFGLPARAAEAAASLFQYRTLPPALFRATRRDEDHSAP